MDGTQAEDELKVEEMNAIAELEQVRQIISRTKGQTKEVMVGGIPVRIKAAIPRPLRLRLERAAQETKNEEADPEEFDDEMYKIMSELCMDEPWTNPQVWKYIDNETGETPKVFTQIMTEIYSDELKLQNFRKKR